VVITIKQVVGAHHCKIVSIVCWFACSEIDEETKMGEVKQMLNIILHN